MPEKKKPEKKPTERKPPEKRPLDMTSDEAIEFLFGQEGAQVLKEHVRKLNEPPTAKDEELKRSAKSSRKHDSK